MVKRRVEQAKSRIIMPKLLDYCSTCKYNSLWSDGCQIKGIQTMPCKDHTPKEEVKND
jgi:hypothetical protein